MPPRLIITLLGLVLSIEGVTGPVSVPPPLGRTDIEADVGPGFVDRWGVHLRQERARTEAHSRAAHAVARAASAAIDYQALPRDAGTLDEGVRLIRLGHLVEGRDRVRRVLEVPQPRDLARRAHDAAGFASLALDDPAGALTHLDAAGELPDALLGPYRDLWRAEALEELGQHEEALVAAEAARDQDPTAPSVHRARLLRAVALLGIDGRELEGVRAVEQELTRYPEYPHRDRLAVAMARAEVRAGARAAAARRLDALLWERPYSGRAGEAAAIRVELAGQGVGLPARSVSDHLARGRRLRLARHWDLAEKSLNDALRGAEAARASTTTRNEIRFELALNAYDSARFQDALDRMDQIEAAGGAGVSTFNRHLWRCRALSRLGREQEAYDVLDAYYRQRSTSERHHRLYELAFDMGMWDVALTHLDALYGRDRDWRRWDGAFTLYLAGRHVEAARLFEALASRASGQVAARYGYWRARSLEHLGEIAEAAAIYARLGDEFPNGYYGLQARNRLAEWEAVRPEGSGDGAWDIPQAPAQRPGRVHWEGMDGPAEAGWSVLHAPDPDTFFAGYPDDLEHDGALATLDDAWGHLFPAVRRANALHRIGAEEDARKVFRDAVIEFRALDVLASQGRRGSESRPVRLGHERWAHFIDNRSNPRGWWGIALGAPRFPVPSRSDERAALGRRQAAIAGERDTLRPLFRAASRELGDYYMVRRFARDDELPPLDTEPLDPRWHEVYPRAHGPELRESVERYDINPFLVWALMIVESDMNPDTVSRADAYGLLQVIPKTGELVALGFGEVDFGIHDLMEAEASLRYGTWYLNELLTKFHGQEMLALVAYNAGPHQVARWLQWRGDGMAMDEFIETVPFDGARRYPQRVLQYISLMRVVNGLDASVYVGNRLDTAVADNIYY